MESAEMSYDREYAPNVPLPDWLKEFADRELKKGSPFDDIKEIFMDNRREEAQKAIEAKVEELRNRVGLDIIEKQASDKGYSGPIEEQTIKNRYYRKVIFTGEHSQLVFMSIEGGQEIGEEIHKSVDQFFRVEKGEAIFVLNGSKKRIKEDEAIIVPAGTKHNVINASKNKPLKLYTIYSPSHHEKGEIEKTKKDEKEVKGSVLLSKRQIRLAESENVFDKYPGIKKHIDNICESREGYIDSPALLQMIKNRPENLSDFEISEIKEYIKEQIKKSKPQDALDGDDDDVIGRNRVEVDMTDEANSEVFSKPSKV